MTHLFSLITPTSDEISQNLPGDSIIEHPTIVMDRAFTLAAPITAVWPWFMQLGKHRSGWYFPRSVEHCIPKKRRGIRFINPSLQNLTVGMRIADWGGKAGYFDVALLEPPTSLVHISTRGQVNLSWAIILWPNGESTRVTIRLRIETSGKKWMFVVGDFFDRVTILWLAAGLRERLSDERSKELTIRKFSRTAIL